jgi:hypothetical protein
VAQAIAQREAITPELLRVLAEAQHNIEHLIESDSMAHIYAMYLLAQFREPRAYPLIVEFFSIPGDIALDTTGDVATEDLGRILASVSCGDIRLMTALVENEHANEYVRVAALRGLVTLVACGEQARDDIIAYLQRVCQGGLARAVSFVWSGLVSASNDLYPEELYDDIKKVIDHNAYRLVNPRHTIPAPEQPPPEQAARPQPPILSVGRLAPAVRASRWRREQRAVAARGGKGRLIFLYSQKAYRARRIMRMDAAVSTHNRFDAGSDRTLAARPSGGLSRGVDQTLSLRLVPSTYRAAGWASL